MLLKPTSKNAITANIVVTITLKQVISCAPLTPTFLPKKPETINLEKGKVTIKKPSFIGLKTGPIKSTFL